MYNDILKIGSITIRGYGLMIAIGIICAFLLAEKRAKKRGLDIDVLYSLGLIALIFGFVGAKVLYCIVEIEQILKNPAMIFSGSGFVVYGGIIAGLIATIFYCRKKDVKFLRYFDLVAPSIAIAQGFGRIGCFLAGCCYGRETDCAIGIVFRHSAIAPNNIKLFPTQIMSSVGDFLIAFILLLYAKNDRTTGNVGTLYLILYSIGRFIIEFFRSDERGAIGILSTSQFISLIVLVVGLIMFVPKKLPWKKSS